MKGNNLPKIGLLAGFLVLSVFLVNSKTSFLLGTKASVNNISAKNIVPTLSYVNFFEKDIFGFVDNTVGGPSNYYTLSNEQNFFGNSNSLKLVLNDSSSGKLVFLKRPEPVRTNTLYRVNFYDDYDPNVASSLKKGVIFEVKKPNSNETTGIGVKTDLSRDFYVFRINNSSGMVPTIFPRKKGWRLFEIIVTDKGTFGKIDNELIYTSEGSDRKVLANYSQTQGADVNLVSTWVSPSTSYFDAFAVIPMSSNSWQEQNYAVLTGFSTIYRNTNFDGVINSIKNYSTGNDIRSLLDTANVFYAEGIRTGDNALIQKARYLLNKTVNEASWSTTGEKWWGAGTFGQALTLGTYMMRNELSSQELTNAKNRIFSEANKFVLDRDSFDNLNSWSTVNQAGGRALIQGNIKFDGNSGLQLNYTSSSGQPIILEKQLPHFRASATSFGSNSRKISIDFYDNMDDTLGTGFGILKPGSTESSGIFVQTNVSKNNYVFRVNNFAGMRDTGIPRSRGWHKFVLVINNQTGTTGYIDDKLIPITNPSQTEGDKIQIVATWGLTGDAYYDRLVAVRMPDSGYIGDSKAEENGWNATFLAEVVNLFPDVPNRTLLEELARCYAYHVITVSSSPAYCHYKSQTSFDDFTIQNHSKESPLYHSAAIHFLTRGAMSYQLTNKQVPNEFKNNLDKSFKRYMQFVDTRSYSYINSPAGSWSGNNNNFYYSAGSIFPNMEALGISTGYSLSDISAKRNIFYWQIPSEYVYPYPTAIESFDQDRKNKTKSYDWFVNANVAGNVYASSVFYNSVRN